MNSWKNDLIFREEIAKVPEITARLSPEKLARAFDYNRQLANVDAIFSRVSASKGSAVRIWSRTAAALVLKLDLILRRHPERSEGITGISYLSLHSKSVAGFSHVDT